MCSQSRLVTLLLMVMAMASINSYSRGGMVQVLIVVQEHGAVLTRQQGITLPTVAVTP